MTFAEYQLREHNYKCITTFWDDFSIADRFGEAAVKDTFKRAFREWRTDYKYLAELVIVLNHKCWAHWHRGNKALSKIYRDLYYEAHGYACENLKGEEFEYYYNIVD